VSDEFKIYLNSKIGKRNKNLEVLDSFFESNELQILKEKSISIVGTNGKTSSAFYLNEIFTKNDISSVLFTSPHLVDVNERIKINNEIISDEKISLYMDDLKQFESENNIELAYFETLFLTSCKLFLESKADYFIVEAGIGGLYDTTSILNVDTVCITNVNYDHMDLLGESLEEIFYQKIQISDNPKRIIFGDPNLYEVHKTYVHDKFDLTDKDIYLNDLESQNKMNLNFGTALKIFESIITNFDEDKTSTVESYPKVPGRFEEVSKNPITEVPIHLMNAETKIDEEFGVGKGYEYDHNSEDGFIKQDNFPKKLSNRKFYNPIGRGIEKTLKDRFEKLWLKD